MTPRRLIVEPMPNQAAVGQNFFGGQGHRNSNASFPLMAALGGKRTLDATIGYDHIRKYSAMHAMVNGPPQIFLFSAILC